MMSSMSSILALATLLLGNSASTFVLSSRHSISRQQCGATISETPSRLFGISEWRDQALVDSSSSTSTASPAEWREQQHGETMRHLPIQVVSSNQVALQGETLHLQFTQDDEVRLFQQAIDHHQGVFGLGFYYQDTNSDGGGMLYDKISLVEIKDYNMMGGEFGIFLTVQVVGRAMLLETRVRAHTSSSSSSTSSTDDKKQPMVGLCSEILNREEKVSLVDASEIGRAVEKLIAEISISELESSSSSFLNVKNDKEDDRWERYREAYHRVLQSDTLGYTYSVSDNEDRLQLLSVGSSDENEAGIRSPPSPQYSWKDLNAISWAAFSTSANLPQDETYRLAALDNDCMTNRLLLATYWLADVLEDVKQEAI